MWCKRLVIVILGAVVVGCVGSGCVPGAGGDAAASGAAPPGSTAGAGAGSATVVRVVDGDTLVVSLGGRDERVRLIGIDTPETKKPDAPVECFGPEASAHLHELLPEGTAIRLERDAELRDKYDRLLAYAHRSSDDLFVNLAMARDGYAGQLTIAPNVTHAEDVSAAVSEARRTGRGLWGSCSSAHQAMAGSS